MTAVEINLTSEVGSTGLLSSNGYSFYQNVWVWQIIAGNPILRVSEELFLLTHKQSREMTRML